jgi:hypothetical protein
MPTLQLEHAVKDFEMWKGAFDRDPIDRRGLGVRRHRVFRPVDDPNYVMVELDFDTAEQAETCRTALHELWGSREAAPALAGAPQVRILDEVEDQNYS